MYNIQLNTLLLLFYIITLTYQTYSLQQDLVAHFPLSKNLEEAQDSRKKLSPEGGSINFSSQDKNGKTSSAPDFDRSLTGLVIPEDYITALGTGDFTVCYWLYQSYHASQTRHLHFNFKNLFWVMYRSNIIVLSQTSQQSLDYSLLDTNTWMHICMVKKNSNLRIQFYKDGATFSDPQSNENPDFTSVPGEKSHIGISTYRSTDSLLGSITDFRIYSTSKTTQQILAIYNSCPTGQFNLSNICTLCPKKFASCSDASTGIKCSEGNRQSLTNNCACKTGFIESPDPKNKACICPLGKFENAYSICQACDQNYSHCTIRNILTVCNGSNRDKSNSCSCKTGYYEDSTKNDDCVKCPKRFSVCNSDFSTVTCQSGSNRNSNSHAQKCSCQSGYYEHPDPSVLTCQKCPKRYSACQAGFQVADITCQGSNRQLKAKDCACQIGYYESTNPNVSDCIQCPEKYSYCNADRSVITCQGQNRQNEANDCACLPGFQEDSSSINCIKAKTPVTIANRTFYQECVNQLNTLTSDRVQLSGSTTFHGATNTYNITSALQLKSDNSTVNLEQFCYTYKAFDLTPFRNMISFSPQSTLSQPVLKINDDYAKKHCKKSQKTLNTFEYNNYNCQFLIIYSMNESPQFFANITTDISIKTDDDTQKQFSYEAQTHQRTIPTSKEKVNGTVEQEMKNDLLQVKIHSEDKYLQNSYKLEIDSLKFKNKETSQEFPVEENCQIMINETTILLQIPSKIQKINTEKYSLETKLGLSFSSLQQYQLFIEESKDLQFIQKEIEENNNNNSNTNNNKDTNNSKMKEDGGNGSAIALVSVLSVNGITVIAFSIYKVIIKQQSKIPTSKVAATIDGDQIIDIKSEKDQQQIETPDIIDHYTEPEQEQRMSIKEEKKETEIDINQDPQKQSIDIISQNSKVQENIDREQEIILTNTEQIKI